MIQRKSKTGWAVHPRSRYRGAIAALERQINQKMAELESLDDMLALLQEAQQKEVELENLERVNAELQLAQKAKS